MKYIKLLLILASTILLSYYLPMLYNYLFVKSERAPFVLYSEIEQTFVKTMVENEQLIRQTIDGSKQYDIKQYDSILPTFYARQLAADKRLPDTIMGRPITLKAIKETNYITRFDPTAINQQKAKVYQLLESAPERINLTAAEDLFMFRDNRIIFFNEKSRSIDKDKSQRFQQEMDKMNIEGEFMLVVGDGNPKKEYDEGYLMLDKTGRLFHLKQVKGQPYIHEIKTDMLNSKVEYISFCGFTDRSKLAFIHSADGKLYLLKNETYEMLPLELPPITHKRDAWMAVGNMFYTTFQISTNDGVMYIAIDSQTGKAVDHYFLKNKAEHSKQMADILFPFRLSFTTKGDPMVYPRIQMGSAYSIR